MSDSIKSPLTERAITSVQGLNGDTILYGVLSEANIDGKPGRDRQLKITTLEQYLFGIGNDYRTSGSIKNIDELYIIGDNGDTKVRTKTTIEGLTRFIIGEADDDYIFDDDDSFSIMKKPQNTNGLGVRQHVTLGKFKKELRDSIAHFKSLKVGYDSANESMEEYLTISEDGIITSVANAEFGSINNSNDTFIVDSDGNITANTCHLKSINIGDQYDGLNIDTDGNISTTGNVASIGEGSFGSLSVNSDNFVVDSNGNVTSRGEGSFDSIDVNSNFTVDSDGNVASNSIDIIYGGSFGSINVNSNCTVDSDGNVASNTIDTIGEGSFGSLSVNSDNFVVDSSGNITSNTITALSEGSFDSIDVNSNFTVDSDGNVNSVSNATFESLTVNTDTFIVNSNGDVNVKGNFNVINFNDPDKKFFKVSEDGYTTVYNNFQLHDNGQTIIQYWKDDLVVSFRSIKVGYSLSTTSLTNNFSIDEDGKVTLRDSLVTLNGQALQTFIVDSDGNLTASTITSEGELNTSSFSVGSDAFVIDAEGNVVATNGTSFIFGNPETSNVMIFDTSEGLKIPKLEIGASGNTSGSSLADICTINASGDLYTLGKIESDEEIISKSGLQVKSSTELRFQVSSSGTLRSVSGFTFGYEHLSTIKFTSSNGLEFNNELVIGNKTTFEAEEVIERNFTVGVDGSIDSIGSLNLGGTFEFTEDGGYSRSGYTFIHTDADGLKVKNLVVGWNDNNGYLTSKIELTHDGSISCERSSAIAKDATGSTFDIGYLKIGPAYIWYDGIDLRFKNTLPDDNLDGQAFSLQ